MACSLPYGQKWDVTDAVKLHVKLMSFSWDEFKINEGGTIPCDFGARILRAHPDVS
jgi:hypothetical protein